MKNELVKHFHNINNDNWEEVFYDACTGNWKNNWTLDGLKAVVSNSEKGMDLIAGPIARDNSCHAVLWTKPSFHGDIKIKYEFTRLDTSVLYVVILYVQATGSDQGQYKKDISEWHNLRTVPSMGIYFDNMNTYHISYAAFGGEIRNPVQDYIRARRYMPRLGKGLKETDLQPDDYGNIGLFETETTHNITVIKKGNELFMRVKNEKKDFLCYWKNQTLPPIVEGRVGLRHMYTRGARYRNILIYTSNG